MSVSAASSPTPPHGGEPAYRASSRRADRLLDVASAITIPILPCADLEDSISFYEALGFNWTYRQQRPNPYAVVELGEIRIHLFGLEATPPMSFAAAARR